MKQKVLILLLISVSCVGVVCTLFFNSLPNVNNAGGFNRKFMSSPVVIHRVKLPYNSYYIAGISGSRIYLGNVMGTSVLTVADSTGNIIIDQQINIDDTNGVAWQGLQVAVLRSRLFAWELVTPKLFAGNVNDERLSTLSLNTPSLDYVLPIASSSVILKSYIPANQQTSLQKIGTNNENYIHTIVLDTGSRFAADGILVADFFASAIIHVPYYSNRVACVDTGLNKIGRFNTIDTIAHPNLETTDVHSQERRTLKRMPVVVNRAAAADNNKLYIHSTRRSNNQSQLSQATIDVYNLPSGNYLGSFYIPVDPKALTSMRVHNGYLYLTAANELLIVRLQLG